MGQRVGGIGNDQVIDQGGGESGAWHMLAVAYAETQPPLLVLILMLVNVD